MTIRQNRLIPISCCLLFLIAAALHASEAPSPALHLVVSNEIAPQGGTVQIKVWASPPVSIARGRLFLYLDPAVFGNIASVGVFSAAGDAYGAPTIQDNGLDLSFTSPSASVGRLPDLPIFTVTVPIRSDATPGATSSILPDASAAPWRDPDGNQYSVQCTPGTVTVGAKLTIANVTAGGGLRPSGTLVRVDGTGFDPGAQLEVEGVSLASVQIVGPEQITFTLAAPAELSGKRVIVRNPDGSQVDYFPSFKPVPADARTAQLLADGQMIPSPHVCGRPQLLDRGSAAVLPLRTPAPTPSRYRLPGSVSSARDFQPAPLISLCPQRGSSPIRSKTNAPLSM